MFAYWLLAWAALALQSFADTVPEEAEPPAPAVTEEAAPEAAVPVNPAPESPAPESPAPESPAPESPAPENAAPGVEAPDASAPLPRPMQEAPEHPQPRPTQPGGESKPEFDDPITGARQYLELYGIDFSLVRFLMDNRPLYPEERETIVHVLHRLPSIRAYDFYAWLRRGITWRNVLDKPDPYRLEAFHVQLRVRQVDVVPLSPELAQRLDMPEYYQVRAQRIDEPQDVVLFTRSVPAAWPLGQLIDERASADALFLKFGPLPGQEPNDDDPFGPSLPVDPAADAPQDNAPQDNAPQIDAPPELAPAPETAPRDEAEPEAAEPAAPEGWPTLYLASARVAWHPERAQPEQGVPADVLPLAAAGLDVSLLRGVIDRANLRTEDREAFYQTLTAVREVGPLAPAEQLTPLGNMLNNPRAMRGQLATIEGRARSATKIVVTDPDIRDRFGIDHYYELIVFLDDRVRVAVTSTTGESAEGIRFESYPVVACVLELPAEMKQPAPGAAAAEGAASQTYIDPENLDVRVRLTGWYFKLYAYETQFMLERKQELGFQGEPLQLSPLLLAAGGVTIVPDPAPMSHIFVTPIILGVVSLVLVLLFFDLLRRREREPLPERIELPGAGPPAEGGPQVDPGEVHIQPAPVYRPDR